MRPVWLLLLLVSTAAAQEAHAPIEIYSDEDWLSPASGRQSGSGTKDDPHIISGWRIEPGLLELPGQMAAIHIEGTEAYAVLRDIVVEDPFAIGLSIFESEHISVEGLTVQSTGRAVSIIDSRDISLDNLDLADNGPDDTAAGILLHQVDGVTLRNIISNGGDGTGIMLSRTSHVFLEGAFVAGHDNGLRIHSGTDVALFGVEAHDNRGDGLYLSNVTGLSLLDAEATKQLSQGGAFSGRGIVILESSGSIRGVLAQGNAAQGMKIWDSDVTLREGRFLDNGQAGLQMSVPSLWLQSIEAHGNTRNGVEIFAPSMLQQATMDAMQLHDNGGAGLFIQGLDGVHVERLRSQANAVGIDVRAARNVTILDSHFLDNVDDGVRFSSVIGGQIVNSRAIGNQDHGFDLHDTVVLVRNNTANENGGAGFRLASGQFRLEHNVAANNRDGPLSIGQAAAVTLLDNPFDAEAVKEESPGFGLPAVVLALALLVRRHQVA